MPSCSDISHREHLRRLLQFFLNAGNETTNAADLSYAVNFCCAVENEYDVTRVDGNVDNPNARAANLNTFGLIISSPTFKNALLLEHTSAEASYTIHLWFISKLLAWLSSPHASSHKDKICELMSSIYHDFPKNLKLQVASLLQRTLKTLMQRNVAMSSYPASAVDVTLLETLIKPQVIAFASDGVEWMFNLRNTPLKLESITSCEYVQAGVCHLVKRIIADWAGQPTSEMLKLWKVLLLQLELGGLPLKQETLDLMLLITKTDLSLQFMTLDLFLSTVDHIMALLAVMYMAHDAAEIEEASKMSDPISHMLAIIGVQISDGQGFFIAQNLSNLQVSIWVQQAVGILHLCHGNLKYPLEMEYALVSFLISLSRCYSNRFKPVETYYDQYCKVVKTQFELSNERPTIIMQAYKELTVSFLGQELTCMLDRAAMPDSSVLHKKHGLAVTPSMLKNGQSDSAKQHLPVQKTCLDDILDEIAAIATIQQQTLASLPIKGLIVSTATKLDILSRLCAETTNLDFLKKRISSHIACGLRLCSTFSANASAFSSPFLSGNITHIIRLSANFAVLAYFCGIRDQSISFFGQLFVLPWIKAFPDAMSNCQTEMLSQLVKEVYNDQQLDDGELLKICFKAIMLLPKSCMEDVKQTLVNLILDNLKVNSESRDETKDYSWFRTLLLDCFPLAIINLKSPSDLFLTVVRKVCTKDASLDLVCNVLSRAVCAASDGCKLKYDADYNLQLSCCFCDEVQNFELDVRDMSTLDTSQLGLGILLEYLNQLNWNGPSTTTHLETIDMVGRVIVHSKSSDIKRDFFDALRPLLGLQIPEINVKMCYVLTVLPSELAEPTKLFKDIPAIIHPQDDSILASTVLLMETVAKVAHDCRDERVWLQCLTDLSMAGILSDACTSLVHETFSVLSKSCSDGESLNKTNQSAGPFTMIMNCVLEEVCEKLIRHLDEEHASILTETDLDELLYNCFSRAKMVFNVVDRGNGKVDDTAFLDEVCKYLIPSIVHNRSPNAWLNGLMKVYNKHNKNAIPGRFFDVFFPFVFRSIYFRPYACVSPDDIGKYIEPFFTPPSKAEPVAGQRDVFKRLLSVNMYRCVLEVMEMYGEQRERTMQAVIDLAKWDGDYTFLQPDGRTADDDVREFVGYLTFRRYGMGIFLHCEQCFMDAKVYIAKKINYLSSLVELIKILPPNQITLVSTKLFSVIRVAMNSMEDSARVTRLCASALTTFLDHVQDSDLNARLAHIFYIIIPLASKYPAELTSIFDSIFKKLKPRVSETLDKITFILSGSEEWAVLTRTFGLPVQAGCSELDLAGQIRLCVDFIVQNPSGFDVFVLGKLGRLLTKKQVALNKLILQSSDDSTDSIIGDLITVLMSCLRSSVPAIVDQALRCLGALGAVDPGRLSSRSLMVDGSSLRFKDVNFVGFLDFADRNSEVLFCINLLHLLTDTLASAANNTWYDRVAFSIQETLKACGIKDQTNEPGSIEEKIWNGLSKHCQITISPMLATQFTVKKISSVSTISNQPLAIARFENYLTWLITCIKTLTKKVKCKRTLELIRPLLHPSSNVIILNQKLAEIILLQILMQIALEKESENLAQVRDTVVDVLRSMLPTDPGTVGCTQVDSSVSDFRVQACQTVFRFMDMAYDWLTKQTDGRERDNSSVAQLLASISYGNYSAFDLASTAAAQCHEYARALYYMEAEIDRIRLAALSKYSGQEIRGSDCLAMARTCAESKLDEKLNVFQELYSCLGELDAVQGALVMRKKQKTPSNREFILAAECEGNYVEALHYHMEETSLHPQVLSKEVQLVKCQMKLNQPNIVERYLAGFLDKGLSAEYQSALQPYLVEAAWKLQRWDRLEAVLPKDEQPRSWGLSLGHILLAVRNQAPLAELQRHVALSRKGVGRSLIVSLSQYATYERAYKRVLRLHSLFEFEQFFKLAAKSSGSNSAGSSSTSTNVDNVRPEISLEKLQQIWNQRLDVIQSCGQSQEPILEIRRQMLSLLPGGPPDLVGQYWLKSARAARKAGHTESAFSFIVKARKFKLPETFIEEAKLEWNKNRRHEAIETLENGLKDHFADLKSQFASSSGRASSASNNPVDPVRLHSYAKASLLHAEYCDESKTKDSMAVLELFKKSARIRCDWEVPYFYLARYYDKLYQHCLSDDVADSEVAMEKYLQEAVKYFLESLKHGNKYLHHSLPSLLTLWLTAAERAEKPSKSRSKRAAFVDTLNNLLKHSDLPAYQLYTAFPQLVSAIEHPDSSVFNVLKVIIAKTVIEYPERCLWFLLAVIRSVRGNRQARAMEIVEFIKRKKHSISPLVADMRKIASQLESVSQFSHPGGKCFSLKENFPLLTSRFPEKRPDRTQKKEVVTLDDNDDMTISSAILLPIQSQMTAKFPEGESASSSTSGHTKQPADSQLFSGRDIYISTFMEQAETLKSLQVPKKLTVRGSDGKLYYLMAKAKDDLRIDSRFMEFSALVNTCMRHSPDARRRHLHIRTYCVVPLSETCGIVEWVPNMLGLRHLLNGKYSKLGLGMEERKARHIYPHKSAALEKKLSIYREKLLPAHPPILGRWFRDNFPDPDTWYSARLAYTRTTAVMSMVGYLVGLGDRHGENLLINQSNGELLHVDFNCLFNKGELLDVPEIVPFRLTPNVVDGFGALGIEGSFRRTCEESLLVIRQHREMMWTVLQTFVRDPLVEWTLKRRGENDNKPNPHAGVQTAKDHLRNIDMRISGALASKTHPGVYGQPLSVKGQVSQLLKEAMDEESLAQMFVGWASYL